MTTAYRSARIVVQNSTNDLLTIEGAEVLLGEWVRGGGAQSGDVIDRQCARAFVTESTVLQRGTEAYVRLGSISGYVHVRWYLPWVGDFVCTAEGTAALQCERVTVLDEEPAAVAALITLVIDRNRCERTAKDKP